MSPKICVLSFIVSSPLNEDGYIRSCEFHAFLKMFALANLSLIFAFKSDAIDARLSHEYLSGSFMFPYFKYAFTDPIIDSFDLSDKC